MHKDTKKALEELEAELLREPETLSDEELDALLESYLAEDDGVYADPPGYQNYANGYRSYNSDRLDVDLDEYSDQVYGEPEAPQAGCSGLVLFSVILTAAALIYMLLRLL